MRPMQRTTPVTLALAFALCAAGAAAYPLDAYEETQIKRLEAYRLAQKGMIEHGIIPPGTTLKTDQMRLRLAGHPNFAIPAPDPDFTAQLKQLLGADARGYGIALLDLTDPSNPRLAAVNPDRPQNPGSVGKIMVGLAWFQTLADLYPDDVEARKRLLLHAPIVANGFIRTDSHVVPFWEPGDTRAEKRALEEGDRASPWTYMDYMLSSSSNAAASMLMSHLVLLNHFGHDYPVSEDVAARFFADTPKKELSRIWLDAIQQPVTRNGMSLTGLRQGSFFTREGKRRVPGTSSVSTPRELLVFMVLMEQGKLVDPFSSLEMKKLLYITDRRVRYAASAALDDSAVYYKSGSLYSCKPEPGYECKKFEGNRWNFLNSATVIETPGHNPPLHYISILLSNVLKKNSAEAHENLAAGVHGMISEHHRGGIGSAITGALGDGAAPSN